jgi:hypothetical protein
MACASSWAGVYCVGRSFILEGVDVKADEDEFEIHLCDGCGL